MLSAPALSSCESAATAVEGLRHAAQDLNDRHLMGLVSWMDHLVQIGDAVGLRRFAELVEARNRTLNSARISELVGHLHHLPARA